MQLILHNLNCQAALPTALLLRLYLICCHLYLQMLCRCCHLQLITHTRSNKYQYMFVEKLYITLHITFINLSTLLDINVTVPWQLVEVLIALTLADPVVPGTASGPIFFHFQAVFGENSRHHNGLELPPLRLAPTSPPPPILPVKVPITIDTILKLLRGNLSGGILVSTCEQSLHVCCFVFKLNSTISIFVLKTKWIS